MNSRVQQMATWIVYALPLSLLTIKPIAPMLMIVLMILGIFTLFNCKNKIVYNRIFVIFSILTCGYFISMVLSVALSSEPSSTWVHLSRIAFFLFAPFLFIVLSSIKVELYILINMIKIETILVGLISIVGAIIAGKSGRYTGMYNANTFSDIVVTLVLLSTVNSKIENIKDFIFTLCAVSFGIIAIVLSGSRAGYIVIIIMLIIYLVLQKIIPYGKPIRAIILFIFSIFIFSISIHLTHNAQNRIKLINTEISQWESGKQNTGSVGIRLEMYRAGIEAFIESPWIGHGYYSATKVASKYATTKEAGVQMSRYWHLHNEYITTIVNAGLMGLFFLLILYLVPLKIFSSQLKNPKKYQYASMGIFLILSYSLLDITHGEFGYEYETLWFIFVLAFSLSRIETKEIVKDA